jgi:DNA-directed RNA polymerase specialized sigma24 family protein
VTARRPFPAWPLAVIAAPAAAAVWSGWAALGARTGFGPVQVLPGITGWRLNTAITLPVGAETYGAYALGAWLTRAAVPARARRFARRSALAALALGGVAQVAAHLLEAAGVARAPWPVTVLIGCVPVVTLGLAASLLHLLGTEPRPDRAAPDTPPVTRTPATRRARRTAATRTADTTARTPAAAADTIRLHRDHPDMPQAGIAAALGISDRTVRRHLAASNGHPRKEP